MKATTTILSLLLAAIASAQAQNPPDVATASAVPGAPIPAVPPQHIPKEAIAAMRRAIQAVPTVRGDQVTAPVRWSYRLGDNSDGASMDIRTRKGPLTFLGVSTSSPSQELSAQLAVPEETSLVVDNVTAGSPAEKAGVQANDVLTKLDDQVLVLPRQLAVLVANHKEGDSVKLSLIRKGQPQEIAVTLGKQEESASASVDVAGFSGNGSIGLTIDGKQINEPLRTFTRRFDLTPERAQEATLRLQEANKDLQEKLKNLDLEHLKPLIHDIVEDSRDAAEDATDGAKGEDESVHKELQDLRRMVEDLTRKIDEKK